MSTAAPKLMTVDEFLHWSEGREGRFELVDGRPIAMAPERAAHLLTKGEAFAALRRAVERAGLPCSVFPDGATVRAFSPKARCVSTRPASPFPSRSRSRQSAPFPRGRGAGVRGPASNDER